jgi:hypothetical protein
VVLTQRSAEAVGKLVASVPISRWLTMQLRCQCRNSIVLDREDVLVPRPVIWS